MSWPILIMCVLPVVYVLNQALAWAIEGRYALGTTAPEQPSRARVADFDDACPTLIYQRSVR